MRRAPAVLRGPLGLKGSAAPLSWSAPLAMASVDATGRSVTTVELAAAPGDVVEYAYVYGDGADEPYERRRLVVGGPEAVVEDAWRKKTFLVPLSGNVFRRFLGLYATDAFEWGDGPRTGSFDATGSSVECFETNANTCVAWDENLRLAGGRPPFPSWIGDGDMSCTVLWAYACRTEQVHWLSTTSFNSVVTGVGLLAPNGDLTLDLRFEQEGPHQFRRYAYRWRSADEFRLDAVFHRDGVPTGEWYGCTMRRIGPPEPRRFGFLADLARRRGRP
jgi:hypothetical protein